MFPLVLPKFFFCTHKFFGNCGDHFVFAFEAGLELFYFLGAQINSARAGRAVKCCRSVLKEGFLPRVEERGMDLVLVADGRDGTPLDKVEFEQADFLLCGILAADTIGFVFVGIHGRIAFSDHSLAHDVKSDTPFGAGHFEKMNLMRSGLKSAAKTRFSC